MTNIDSYLADVIAGRLIEREKSTEAEKLLLERSNSTIKRTRTHNKDKEKK
jgi:hypothetical protein